MAIERFTRIILGNNLTGTDNADGTITIDATSGSSGISELVYTEFTGNVSPTATTEGSANTIVTASAFTAAGSTSYWVEFFCPYARPDNAAAARNMSFWLFQDGSSIGKLGFIATPAANSMLNVIFMKRKVTPSAGSRTYSIRCSVSAGTGLVAAGAGGSGTDMPGFIRVTTA